MPSIMVDISCKLFHLNSAQEPFHLCIVIYIFIEEEKDLRSWIIGI